MSYIGKSPAVGNFVKLDNISTSSTNTYNLTVDSVAFVPESANHMLVSLNGVIQAPLSSFSVSGSTITFLPASGTLSSSDSIDFIMVYGNVLDIGTPSDATVTNAKTNFVSTSSSAGLQIKGDGTTDGTLQLNCSQNSHGIKLKSPPHSASASYTLTFPNNDGSSGEALTTDGSGVLTWATAGESNVPVFSARKSGDQGGISDNTYTKVTGWAEIFDPQSTWDNSNSKFVPAVVGRYLIIGTVYMSHIGNANSRLAIYLNGSSIEEVQYNPGATSQAPINVVGVVDVTNSSDYIELYVYQPTGQTGSVYSAGIRNQFSGFKIT